MTPNQSHGHVTPNADGYLARCGGPSICAHCQFELAQLRAKSAPAEAAQGEVEIVAWLLEHEKGGWAVDLNSQAMQVMQQSVGGIISALMTVAQHSRIVAALTPPSPDAELVKLMRDASVAMSSAHESLFKQCLSNGITNAWGNPVDVSKINDLQIAAKRIDAKLASL